MIKYDAIMSPLHTTTEKWHIIQESMNGRMTFDLPDLKHWLQNKEHETQHYVAKSGFYLVVLSHCGHLQWDNLFHNVEICSRTHTEEHGVQSYN